MSNERCFFGTNTGVILAGAVIGAVAAVLVKLGNPGNMGVCVACFSRDIAGALGLHRFGPAQYLRPELSGFVLGALASALLLKEFKPRTGSAAVVRFVLGICAAIGTLVFLGCTWRVFLRLGGGDANALYGILGLVLGIGVAVVFMKRGYSLGRSRPAPWALGWVMPVLAVLLVALLLWDPKLGLDADKNPTGPIFATAAGKGPGSMHAIWYWALAGGLLIGFLAQRSRFCTVGALRNIFVMQDLHLFNGVAALVVANAAVNVALSQFKWGLEGQPFAHTQTLWNVLGMVLAGLAFTLGGGCPGRQFILAGEGDSDAGVFCLGMIGGTALAHNFALVSAVAKDGSPGGPGPAGQAAVIGGLIVCAIVGLAMREPKEG